MIKWFLPAFAALRGGGGESATCGREAKREAEEVAVRAVFAEVEMGEGGESVPKIQIFYLFLFQVQYQWSRVYMYTDVRRKVSLIESNVVI